MISNQKIIYVLYTLLYVQLCVMLHTQESRKSDQLISSHTKLFLFLFILKKEKRKNVDDESDPYPVDDGLKGNNKKKLKIYPVTNRLEGSRRNAVCSPICTCSPLPPPDSNVRSFFVFFFFFFLIQLSI